MNIALSIAVFLILGLVFVCASLVLNRLLSPRHPDPEKAQPYECGERPFGPAWVQFDLRFYLVALFYLIFDVEVALLFPWAVILRDLPLTALVLGLPFLLVVVIGYAYEWASGTLDWVRQTSPSRIAAAGPPGSLSALARRDPEFLNPPDFPSTPAAPAS